jgi:tetratricopeptide (TPR) repeat protein
LQSHGRIAALLALCGGTLCTGVSSARADEALDDLIGRIEYAFYSADSRSLQQSWQELNNLQVEPADNALRDSYLDYGRWKMAQLLATDNPAQAQQFALACAESRTTAKDASTLATHHALAAACYGMLEMLRPLRRLLYRGDREAALGQALQERGNAPQILFVAAWLGLQQESVDQAYSLLTRALDGFSAIQTTGQTVSHSANPDWGYAETCYLLGKLELVRGNTLAARNALEQALVQAPDYRDARLLLQSLNLR